MFRFVSPWAASILRVPIYELTLPVQLLDLTFHQAPAWVAPLLHTSKPWFSQLPENYPPLHENTPLFPAPGKSHTLPFPCSALLPDKFLCPEARRHTIIQPLRGQDPFSGTLLFCLLNPPFHSLNNSYMPSSLFFHF